MALPTITIIGNLTADPELRFTANGVAVANFTVAMSERKLDKETNTWSDGATVFLQCSCWRGSAENVAESLQKGMNVIVTGKLTSRSFENKEGQKVTVNEIFVDDIGPSLRNATAKVTKIRREGDKSPVVDKDPWGEQTASEVPF